jgi:hypothetical protein
LALLTRSRRIAWRRGLSAPGGPAGRPRLAIARFFGDAMFPARCPNRAHCATLGCSEQASGSGKWHKEPSSA